MLTTLCIEHFAIVKHLELDFANGMTAFTGETGAGKSIMIDALMLALGGRADASVIRPGEDKCEITAGFYIEANSEPAQWLSEHDLQVDGDELFLRRVINTDGRSKSYINGQPFPLQKVRELSEKLVHIHGQHQQQTLMNHQTHRQQLDQYANHHPLLNEVYELYKKCQQLQRDIEALKNIGQQSDKIKLLQFQIAELNELDLKKGEFEELQQEQEMLHHAKEYLELSQNVSTLLNNDDQPHICSNLNQILNLLSQLPQEQNTIKTTVELINNALIQCEEATAEMQQFTDRIQLDPERLHAVEMRMSTIHQLARKYHMDSRQLAEHALHLQNELEILQNSETQLSQLELQRAQACKSYDAAAAKLTESRRKHAPLLAKEITNSIQQLGMPKGWVEIEITPTEHMQTFGKDKIEYKVCTNPGMQPDSLNKIASGGELSRISLAIQLITAQRGATPTLLFDEVDVGIGGATAALVGHMLRKLGERLQVFCVTHQPQVAAAAHNHYRVEKHIKQQKTFTEIALLNASGKIDEIARMLGGITITEHTRSHANELIGQNL